MKRHAKRTACATRRRRPALRVIVRGGFLVALLTSCASIIGVPDLTFDESAPQGNPDGSASNSDGSSGTDGQSTNPDATPSCNADLKTDKANCGACGHDCTNGDCADGVCTLRSDLSNGPSTIAVSGDTIYIGLQDDSSGPIGIASCPTNGCNSATVGIKQLSNVDASVTAWQVVVASDTVYMTDYYSFNKGMVWKLPTQGGKLTPAITPLASQQRAVGLATDGKTIFWSADDTGGGVFYCDLPCAGSPQRMHTLTSDPGLVALANGKVIYEDGSSLFICNSKTDCATPTAVPISLYGNITALTVDSDVLYWAANPTGTNHVYSCALTPLCATPTPVVDDDDAITAMTVASGHVYWATLPANDAGVLIDTEGTIKSCPIAGCSANKTTLATKQKSPAQMVVDAKSVYLINDGSRGNVNGIGSLVKFPRQ